MLLLLLKYYY